MYLDTVPKADDVSSLYKKEVVFSTYKLKNLDLTLIIWILSSYLNRMDISPAIINFNPEILKSMLLLHLEADKNMSFPPTL